MRKYKFFGVNEMESALGQTETIATNTFFNRSHNSFKLLHSLKVGLILENSWKSNHAIITACYVDVYNKTNLHNIKQVLRPVIKQNG